MRQAERQCARFNQLYIGSEHIFLALLCDETARAVEILKHFGLDPENLRHEVENLLETDPYLPSTGGLAWSPEAKKVIEYSMQDAVALRHNRVGTEHILLGLLCEHEGVAARVLSTSGLTLEQVRNELRALPPRPEGRQASG